MSATPIPNGEQKVQVVRTRTFRVPPNGNALYSCGKVIAGLVLDLQREGFTGKLCVNFSQGGVCSVVAEEKLPNQF